MALRLAWHDLLHRRARTAAALVGVVFAIVLIFMQSGFYLACRASATRVHALLDYDVMITSQRYAFVMKADALARDRLHAARAVDGVAGVAGVLVAPSLWLSPTSRNRYDLVLLGVDLDDRPFQAAAVDGQLDVLRRTGTVLFDHRAHPVLGDNPPGTVTEFNGHRVEVAGEFEWGAGFVANGLAVSSRPTFARLVPDQDVEQVQLGLVRLEPGADADRVVRDLRARLPADVAVWRRSEVEAADRRFFLSERPIGIMFTSGVLLALTVGGIIIFQILASEVTSRRSEFATLQALGYSQSQVYGLVLTQGFLYTLAAFLPSAALAWLLFDVTREMARLPMRLDLPLLAAVLGASLLMSLSGALVASRKVRQADPAELF